MNEQPITKQKLGDGSSLIIAEDFYSIQTEGPWAGLSAYFIRLGGCNLRCSWCDTDYSTDNCSVPIEVIVSWITAVQDRPKRVVITGGEPMAQNILPLIDRLEAEYIDVQIETNGTLWVPNLESRRRPIIVCSPKTNKLHPMILRYCRHYKYIIGAEDMGGDGPSAGTQTDGAKGPLFPPPDGSQVWVQPRYDDHREENERAAVGMVLKHGYRLSYQLHKQLGLR